ncbi:hypothetical protein DD598_30470 [Enterobacter cloacae complex sp. 2DZ2F16B1]|nr:hypothetical protein DD598_30470 [Enterobacter cloacae complex sp. 2DZ2F16B1]
MFFLWVSVKDEGAEDCKFKLVFSSGKDAFSIPRVDREKDGEMSQVLGGKAIFSSLELIELVWLMFLEGTLVSWHFKSLVIRLVGFLTRERRIRMIKTAITYQRMSFWLFVAPKSIT